MGLEESPVKNTRSGASGKDPPATAAATTLQRRGWRRQLLPAVPVAVPLTEQESAGLPPEREGPKGVTLDVPESPEPRMLRKKAIKYDDMVVRMPRNAKAGDVVEFETVKGEKAQITVPAGSRDGQKIKVKVPHRDSFSAPFDPANDALEEVFDEMVVRMPRNAKAGDTVEFEIIGRNQFARITVPQGARERQILKVQVPQRKVGMPVLGSTYRIRLGSNHRSSPAGAYLDVHRSMHKDIRTKDSTFVIVHDPDDSAGDGAANPLLSGHWLLEALAPQELAEARVAHAAHPAEAHRLPPPPRLSTDAFGSPVKPPLATGRERGIGGRSGRHSAAPNSAGGGGGRSSAVSTASGATGYNSAGGASSQVLFCRLKCVSSHFGAPADLYLCGVATDASFRLNAAHEAKVLRRTDSSSWVFASLLEAPAQRRNPSVGRPGTAAASEQLRRDSLDAGLAHLSLAPDPLSPIGALSSDPIWLPRISVTFSGSFCFYFPISLLARCFRAGDVVNLVNRAVRRACGRRRAVEAAPDCDWQPEPGVREPAPLP